MPTAEIVDEKPEVRRKLFDLPDGDGVNASERILTNLCRRSFLRLWSQTNVFTDEGFKNGKGATKELCDALVIFGDDVIIFSDKHVTFQADRELTIAWPRWYRRAILESIKQLHGAASWLTRFPDRAFLDGKCSRPLPINVPEAERARFHLVAVTRGSRAAVLGANGGEGIGTFGLNSGIEGDHHLQRPFTVGRPVPDKKFVHVFDEVAIDLLLKHLDTAPDFLGYLKKRERLLDQEGSEVVAFGEEELLAAYLRTMSPDGEEHVFVNLPIDAGIPDTMIFGEGFFKGLREDPGYARKLLADAVSYEWDRLIDRFLEYGDPGLHSNFREQSGADSELGLRLMAAESRFRRRQLAEAFGGALQRVEPGMRLGRLFYSGVAGETVFVFVIVAKKKEENYLAYREHRFAVLHAYVQTAKLKAPLGDTFVGIAFDNPHKDEEGGSEDLFVIKKTAWTQEELEELETMRRDLGLWGPAMEMWRFRQDEFPQANQRVALQRMPLEKPRAQKNARGDSKKTQKQIQKSKNASKRRNRGKK